MRRHQECGRTEIGSGIHHLRDGGLADPPAEAEATKREPEAPNEWDDLTSEPR